MKILWEAGVVNIKFLIRRAHLVSKQFGIPTKSCLAKQSRCMEQENKVGVSSCQAISPARGSLEKVYITP